MWTAFLSAENITAAVFFFFLFFFLSEYELENNLKQRSNNVKSAPKACPETEADDVFDLVFILFYYYFLISSILKYDHLENEVAMDVNRQTDR